MRTSLSILAVCISFGLLSCEREEATWLPRDGERIGAVEIQYAGASVIDEGRLRNFLRLTTGSIYTLDAVDRDIRALYESGLVEDVRVLAEPYHGDVRLVFEVETRPPPGPPIFIGNTAFSDIRLTRELDFGVGTKPEGLTDERLQANAEVIEDLYRREGYPEVSVRLRAFGGGPATLDDFQFLIEEGVQQPPR